MSWQKRRQLDHYFVGVGSKDIPGEVKGRGRKGEKRALGLQAGFSEEARRSDHTEGQRGPSLVHAAGSSCRPWASVHLSGA